MRSARGLSERLCGSASADPVWVDEQGTVDRRSLHGEVERYHDLLADDGVEEGRCVAVQAVPGVSLFALLLAVWRRGARAMLLDHRLTPAETERLTALCTPHFRVRDAHAARHFTDASELVIEATGATDDLPGDACLVQFTSGSTGRSKVVGRSAASLDAELDRYAAVEDMPGSADRLLLLCSPTHTWGLVGGVLHGLAAQVPVLFAAAAHGGAVVRAARALDATAVFGVTTHFEMLGRTAELTSLPRLRVATSAGMTTSPAVAERFRTASGCPLGQVYGLTETGVVTADLTGRFPGTVGRPAPGVEVRTSGGELHVRSDDPYLVHDGVERYVDGWLRTFDRGTVDPTTGAVTVLGRADSVVAVGGIKVDLVEIEQVLQEHPGVTQVVVTYGSTIEAHVAADADLTDRALAAWTRERLSPLKVPKRYYLHDQLLQTPTGKVVRDRAQLLSAVPRRAGVGSEQGDHQG